MKDILDMVLLSSSRTVSSQGVLYLHHRGMEGRELLLLRRGTQNSVTRPPQSLILVHLILILAFELIFCVHVGELGIRLPHPCGSYQFME